MSYDSWKADDSWAQDDEPELDGVPYRNRRRSKLDGPYRAAKTVSDFAAAAIILALFIVVMSAAFLS